MARHSFRRQILFGYGVATGLTALVLVWGLVDLLRLGKASDAILRENYRSILAAANMRDAIQRQEAATVFLLVQKDLPVVERLSDAQQRFLLNLAEAKDNITLPGEKEVLDQIDRDYHEYMLRFTEFVQLPRTDSSAALAYYRENLQPRVSTIRQACERLLNLNQAAMVSGSELARRVASTAVWSMLVVGSGAIAAGVVFSLLLSARIIRPLRQLMEATQRVAAGDYGVQVACPSSDEFANLAEHFNAMVAKLRIFNELRIGEIIAEKKKTEAILETIDDGIFVVDSQQKIVSVNPAARRALGVTALPSGLQELRGAIPCEEFVRDVQSALESGTAMSSARQDNFLTVRHGEKQQFFEYSIAPVRAAADKLLGVVAVLRDVTRLRELDRLKSEFVMTASHELRTPLTSLEMSVHLLRERSEDKLDASDRELLGVASEEVTRLKHLVNELLDLTKIESGRIEMHMTEMSPRVLLENGTEPFRAQASQQSVELLLDVPDDLPKLRVDRDKITWVVTNLVGNALRYTSPGGHIWVSAERAGRWVHLYCRDDGAGIPHNKQAAIFGKFVQLEESGPPGGAGLGLAISKEIVRAHRGHIWVESEPGRGSLFTVALPH